MRKHAAQLGGNPLGADHGDLFRHRADGVQRAGVKRKVVGRRETHGPQQPQLVLGEPASRVADGADHAGLDVRHAADKIDDALGQRIVEQSVHREVAPLSVVLGVGERDRLRTPAVEVVAVGAERGDFDRLERLGPADRDHAERGADRQRTAAAEQLAHHIGQCARGDVVILGSPAQQLVAHAAAGKQRFVAGVAQPLDDFDGERTLLGRGGHKAVC